MATTSAVQLDPNAISTVGGTNTAPSTSQINVSSNYTNQQSSGSVANSGAIGQAAAATTAVTPGSVQAKQGSNLIGNVSDVYNTGKSLFGGLNKAVDGFGQGLGFSNPYLQGPTASGVPLGASSQAGTFTGASLGQALGGAALGYTAGGFISGLVGGNKVGGQIGGALGGLAGSVFLSGLTTGIGAELGATIGSIVPGIGTVIGAVAGSLLGGMFGGGEPHPAGYMNQIGINPDGTLKGGAFQANASKHVNASVFDPYKNDFGSYLSGQVKKYGLTNLNPDANVAFTTSIDGNFGGGLNSSGNVDRIGIGNDKVEGSGKEFGFNPTDNASKQAAYDNAFNHLLELSNIDKSTLKEVNPIGGTQSNVTIPAVNNPSQWQQFLDTYRQQHTTPSNSAQA